MLDLEIEKIFEVLLSEKEVPIGNVFQCIPTSDSQLVILNIEASDIKQFDFRGNYIKTLVKRGNSPTELLAPRHIGLNDKFLLVADFATNSIKVFTRNDNYLKQIFPEEYTVTMGNIRFLTDKTVLNGASSDRRGYIFAGTIIDTTGKLIDKCVQYPNIYQNYRRLVGIYHWDANSLGDCVISFAKSPDIYLGNTRGKSGIYKNYDKISSNIFQRGD